MLRLVETPVGRRIQEIRVTHKKIRDALKPKKKKTRPWQTWTTAELKLAIALKAEGISWRIVAMRLGTGRSAGSLRVAVYRFRKGS